MQATRDDWFWKAYQTHQLRVHALARQLVSSQSRNEGAEDLCHEIWIQFHRSGRHLRAEAVRAWLFKTARNLAVEISRKRLPDRLAEDYAIASISPTTVAQAADTERTLGNCLEQLAVKDPQAAEVIRGSLRGETSVEIATRLKIPRDRVDRVKFDGRSFLKDCIESGGVE